MGHVHTDPGQHDLTVSAFIVRDAVDGPRLLLHRHKTLELLLQPGGHVELDEDPWSAILREIVEETGFSRTQLSVLQPPLRLMGPIGDSAILHPQPVSVLTHDIDAEGRHRHTDLGFAFLSDGEPIGLPAIGEATNLLWASLEDLPKLVSIPANVRAIAGFVLGTARLEWEPVPVT